MVAVEGSVMAGSSSSTAVSSTGCSRFRSLLRVVIMIALIVPSFIAIRILEETEQKPLTDIGILLDSAMNTSR